MTTISKSCFNEFVGGKTCIDIIHPWTTNCSKEWLTLTTGTVIGSMKFFTIIYAVQLLMRGRRITKKYLREQMLLFVRSCAYGFSMGTMFTPALCLTRRLLGQFYYHTAIMLPGTLAGLSIFLENSSMKQMNTIFFFNMVLEATVRVLRSGGGLLASTIVDTAFFMLTNAVLMYLLRANHVAHKATKLLWFFDPRESKHSRGAENKCCVTVKCRKHTIQESLKYFGFGYAYQTMKSLLPRLLTLMRKPRQLLSVAVNRKAVNFGMFMGTYVLIYKMVCRELHEVTGREAPGHHLLAGFLAGISHAFKPNIAMALMPITYILQIFWLNIRAVYKLPEWPYTELLFAVCNGVLFHTRMLLPNYCPQYIHNMMYVVTNGKCDSYINNFVRLVNQTMAKQQRLVK